MIPLTGPPGSVIHWQNNSSYLYMRTDLSHVEFRILDSSSLREVDLNGNSFQIQLGVLTDEDDVVSIV